jgi:hypothetical protein
VKEKRWQRRKKPNDKIPYTPNAERRFGGSDRFGSFLFFHAMEI